MARPLPASSSPSPPSSSNGNTKPHAPVVAVSLLQPRVAVALGIPKSWYLTLSACRLLSIVPPIFWGIRFTLRFLLADLLRLSEHRDHGRDTTTTFTLRLTETALAIIWVCRFPPSLSRYFVTIVLVSLTLISVAPRPISPFSSPIVSCRDGLSTTPRKRRSCASLLSAAPSPT